MRFFPSPIGCNIVTEVDTCDFYTEEVYAEQLVKYRDEGFAFVEFSHVLPLEEEAARRLQALSNELGITIWSVHSCHLNEYTPEALAQYYRDQAHCAKISGALGAQVMTCHLPNVENRLGDFTRDLDILTKVADLCRKNSVKLAIETCEKGDPAYIIHIVDTLGREDVGINVDVGHVNALMREQAGEVIRQCGARINTLHLHDNYGENDDHQMPGLGTIDWRDVLRALREVGYRGPLMMEMTGPGGKCCRTVERLRSYEIEKERIQGAAWLDWLWRKSTEVCKTGEVTDEYQK